MKITPPTGSGSFYWNYKDFSSLVLMSVANANYEFLYCDIGTNGRVSDGGVIENFTKSYCIKNLIFPCQENLTTVQVICYMCF